MYERYGHNKQMIKTRITDGLGIEYPIFQGGMAWIADGKLAAAVSNGGGLGIISAMAGGDYLRGQIREARKLTDKPIGVNLMLQSPTAEEAASILVEEKVEVVTTGAGMPTKFMPMWLDAGDQGDTGHRVGRDGCQDGEARSLRRRRRRTGVRRSHR